MSTVTQDLQLSFSSIANAENARNIEVSIVMPCLNEAETLGGCIKEAFAAIKETGVKGEVVIADNGSTDGSQQIARNLGARVVDITEKGYGAALRGGITAAYGKYVLMGDSDGSYNFKDLSKFLPRLRSGDDLVMGCRLPAGGGTIEPGAMPWSHRWIGNPILTLIGKIFFQAKVDDFQCGIRAFNRESILNLNLHTPGMEFSTEMVVKSTLAKQKIGQIPVTLRPDGRNRPPHLRTWRDGWRYLKFLLLYCPKWMFLYPGLAITILGVAGFLLLLPGPMIINNIQFDTSTMLVCALMVVVGYQTIMSYLFAKFYAVSMGLLPKDTKIKGLVSEGPIERGILIGIFLVLMGFGLLSYAFFMWGQSDFGIISYSGSLHIVIPAVTLIALGTQTFFSGFILGVLNIKSR